VLDEADHMADLGFLPSVKRILDRTPRGSQRMLFSATLDNGVDGLVRRYLDRPVTHSVDEESAPNADLIHHVLHVDDADRVGLLVDMLSRSDRTVVFTRTKHRAKRLTKQLVSAGVAAVELHGNLSQGARIRNLDAFGDGSAVALVATDIAARGIHVDDVGLVIHADPPVEHKAYVHRSGRTARAGSSGVVVTMMTDEQRSDVAALTRKAGVKPTTTRASAVSDLDGLGIVGATIVMPAVRNLPSAGSARSGPRPSTSEGARSGGARRPNRSKAGSNRAAPTEAARPGGGRRRRRRRAGRPSASAV
jgi:superfamily II DNA/RNA helicase